MTRRNPERPPGPSYYRLPEASWIMIRDEYLSGWTAKEIGAKWRVSTTSVYRHASDGGWNKYDRGQAFHDQIVAESAAAPQGPDAIPWSWKAPPEGLRQGPRPLPGMWRPPPRRVWSPPEGYGPMPAHLVPPWPHPSDPERGPEPEPALDDPDPPSPAPSAGEAADRATAAAGRAVAEGRYQEAERLGRLAVTLQKLAGGETKKPSDRVHSVEDEEAEADMPEADRPLNCTMNTCAVHIIYRRAEETLGIIFDKANAPLAADLLAWTAMGEALDATADPEVVEIAAALRAKGIQGLHGKIGALLGPIPSRPRAPEMELFRGR